MNLCNAAHRHQSFYVLDIMAVINLPPL